MSLDKTEKIKIGISSCLLGQKVRYDGGHAQSRYITDTLGQFFQWIPICPEVEFGLPVPREAMHLTGDPVFPRLVTIHTGIDYTEGMKKWAEDRLDKLALDGICGFIFKSRSPSSGIEGVKVYNEKGVPEHTGTGIFAAAYMRRFPLCPVEDDNRFNDQHFRENFFKRIFVFNRWQLFLKNGASYKDLIDFHANHKLLILSHSPKHYTILGRLVADSRKKYTDEIINLYIRTVMEGLNLISTTKKNTNVLQHIAGYFKKQLSMNEKQELSDIIEQYHKELMPLIVPITLLNHYVLKYNESYLEKQYYLNPYPLELMLRNHA